MAKKLITDILIDNIFKSFPDGKGGFVKVIDGISIKVARGEIVSILGPSGCGKTTLINLLAGYNFPDSGYISHKDKIITGPGNDRVVAFQDYALFPWKTVAENIGFGLKCKCRSNKKISIIVEKYIKKFNLIGFDKFYPTQLSGGMKQRVGLARVLAVRPEIILLDETFSSLDEQNREIMQEVLLKIHLESKPTIIFVTHNIEEAIFVSDRIIILSKRPAVIKTIIDIPFKRIRIPEIRNSIEFLNIKKQIWKNLREEYLTE